HKKAQKAHKRYLNQVRRQNPLTRNVAPPGKELGAFSERNWAPHLFSHFVCLLCLFVAAPILPRLQILPFSRSARCVSVRGWPIRRLRRPPCGEGRSRR